MKNIPWRAFLTISILLIPLTVGGCPWITDTGDTTTVDPKLSAFQSSSDVVDYFRQQATNRTQTRSRGIFGIGLWAAAENEGSLADDSATGAEQTSDGDTNYSTTNLQEAGVDESDLFKSDGTNFYIAKGTQPANRPGRRHHRPEPSRPARSRYRHRRHLPRRLNTDRARNQLHLYPRCPRPRKRRRNRHLALVQRDGLRRRHPNRRQRSANTGYRRREYPRRFARVIPARRWPPDPHSHRRPRPARRALYRRY